MIAVRALNAGRLISRGRGRHVSRKITSWELIFVISGRLGMFYRQERYELHAGECLLIAPDEPHGGTADYPPDLSFFWIHFFPESEEAQEQLRSLHASFHAVNQPRLAEYFQLFLSLQQELPEDPKAKDHLLQLILHEALKLQAEPDAAKPHPDPRPALLGQLERILHLRYREPLSTAQLAAELDCNPDYLGRLYRQYCQTTITDTLNELRIDHARDLLRFSRLSVTEICYEVGFNDPAYFRRRFFRREAMTPGQFRKQKSTGFINTE